MQYQDSESKTCSSKQTRIKTKKKFEDHEPRQLCVGSSIHILV